ncbi:MAG: GNAT family N-acetyltransferase, partial [Bacteroidota bacterium]|nr:GNAT family N-acetyltransferase [Bacteroidota bacterium]
MDITELTWDSHLFGYKVGRKEQQQLSPSDISAIYTSAQSEGYRLVYIFTQAPVPSDIESKGTLIRADRKVTYSKKITEDSPVHSSIASFPKGSYTEKLLELAFESGCYSRFKIDKNFVNDEFKKLYTLWIKNSITREIADDVFVYQENDIETGFITLKISEGICTIGLIAVDATSRGKGIGHLLISLAEHYAFQNNCHTLQVDTQEDNRKACNFYESCSF